MTISDATIEQAARAMLKRRYPGHAYEMVTQREWTGCIRDARAALESVGYEEAATLLRDVACKWEHYPIAARVAAQETFMDRARAWSSRYTPDPK